jgi:hypothetical protein
MGATTRQQGRTQGLSEVQESVLEHATPEAHQEQAIEGKFVAKVGTMVTAQMSEIPFIYKVPTDSLENPDKIKNLTVTLPSGAQANFIRSGGWVSRP